MFKKSIMFCSLLLVLMVSLTCIANAATTVTDQTSKIIGFSDIAANNDVLVIDESDADHCTVTSLAPRTGANYYNGTFVFTGGSGSYITVKFEGKIFGFVGNKGGYDIYIDDVMIDTYGLAPVSGEAPQIVYFTNTLTDGAHTAKVVTNKDTIGGQYSLFDAFIIADPSPSNPSSSDNYSYAGIVTATIIVAACALLLGIRCKCKE